MAKRKETGKNCNEVKIRGQQKQKTKKPTIQETLEN